MDILESLIQDLTDFVWRVDRRFIFLWVRLALLYLNTTLLLVIGRIHFRPSTFHTQVLMVFLGALLSLTCSVRGILNVSHWALLWLMVLGLLIIWLCPPAIGYCVSPDPQVRTRISRFLYIFAAGAVLLQTIVILAVKS